MGEGYLHVVAGAIINARKQVLITRRPHGVHQGGKWEFPGGKVERGESSVQALSRELDEELGIRPMTYEPLIKIRHAYAEKRVLLDVWRITKFEGEPTGREGQRWTWSELTELRKYPFPAANQPILKALNLPKMYLITPEPGTDWRRFMLSFRAVLERGHTLIRMRAKSTSVSEYLKYTTRVIKLGHSYGARVLIDYDPRLVGRIEADGVHLTAKWLMQLRERPFPDDYLLGASCHSSEELDKASQIGADFALVSPVMNTQSHPNVVGMGWKAFATLCDKAKIPVYALGGMTPADVAKVCALGGQGIAAIRSLWPRG